MLGPNNKQILHYKPCLAWFSYMVGLPPQLIFYYMLGSNQHVYLQPREKLIRYPQKINICYKLALHNTSSCILLVGNKNYKYFDHFLHEYRNSNFVCTSPYWMPKHCLRQSKVNFVRSRFIYILSC